MGEQDVELATRFLSAANAALQSGDREPAFALVTQDVEWVTPERTFHGIDEVREHLIWGFPPEHLDVELEVGEVIDLGDGRSDPSSSRSTAGRRQASSPTSVAGGST